MRHTCRVCMGDQLDVRLEFGPQAIRNRYLSAAGEKPFEHPLTVGCCGSCGAVQLLDPPPVAELRPRFDWISYNEPERHLDDLVTGLTELPGVTRQSVFAGLTYKDDSTLARLTRLGFVKGWRPDIGTDLGVSEPNSGIESIQATLTAASAVQLADKFGRPDVLIARHVLEHTHDTRAALAWAAHLVAPGGYVVFEVPDATRALECLDYTTIWEEHSLYFTPTTLRRCVAHSPGGGLGLEVVEVMSYPYTLEDSLVVIARAVPRSAPIPGQARVEVDRAARFVREYPKVRARVQNDLHGRGRIAVLGAGHMTGAFLDLYGLGAVVDFVADDNARKQGLWMPGSRLPIVASSELVGRGIDLCLMTVRPEIEDRVVERNAAFTASGGVMASIFPNSPYALGTVRTHERAVA